MIIQCVIAIVIAGLLRERWRTWRALRAIPRELRGGWRRRRAWPSIGWDAPSIEEAEPAAPSARLLRGMEVLPRPRELAAPDPPWRRDVPMPDPPVGSARWRAERRQWSSPVGPPPRPVSRLADDYAGVHEHGASSTTPARPYVRPPPTRMPGPGERCSR